MKKIIPILLVGILIISGYGAAANLENQTIKQEVKNINFSQPVINNYDEYIKISIEEANSYLIKENKPLLPSHIETFTFPFGTKINKIEIKPLNIQQKTISKQIVSSPKAVQVGLEIDDIDTPIEYSDELYPNEWYDYKIGSGIIDNKLSIILKIELYPISYLPYDNLINIAEEFKINIDYEEPNFQDNSFDDEFALIILTPSEFSNQLNSLVTHKINRGISTKLVTLNEIYGGTYFTTEGRDEAEKIKYFIKNAIENWGTSYVLIIGGDSEFPARKTHVKVSNDDQEIFVSDLYYADIYNETGAFSSWDTNENDIFAEYKWSGETDILDLYPDVYLGRLACVNSNEVTASVNKIITYETNVAYTQDWFTNIVTIGGDSFTDSYGDDSGVNEGELVNSVVIDIMDGFIPNRVWASNGKLNGIVPSGVAEITNAIEDGAGFVDFSGHGNTFIYATYSNNGSSWIPTPTGGFFNFQIKDLNNGDMLPIVITGACSVGKYNVDSDCFSWSFVLNPDGGGIASCGATALGYAYIGEWAPYGLVEGMAINMFEAYKDGAITFGEMWVRALNDYIEPGLNAGDYKTIEEWQPFGDPSLAIGEESLEPAKPNTPEGPTSGKINEEQTYTASTTDPDDDELYYLFDWGDGEYSGWIGPYNSGQTAETTYAWTEKGDYEIRVKAKDEHGVQSEWSDPLPISMPKGKQNVNDNIVNLLEQYPNLFPILRKIMGL